MAAVLANDLLPVVRQDLDGRLVSHGSGDNIQARFAPENFRRPFLEAIDRGILAVDVIPHLGVVHGLSHRGGRLGDGVAAQIYKCIGMILQAPTLILVCHALYPRKRIPGISHWRSGRHGEPAEPVPPRRTHPALAAEIFNLLFPTSQGIRRSPTLPRHIQINAFHLPQTEKEELFHLFFDASGCEHSSMGEAPASNFAR